MYLQFNRSIDRFLILFWRLAKPLFDRQPNQKDWHPIKKDWRQTDAK